MTTLKLFISNEQGDIASIGDSIQIWSPLPFGNGYCGTIRQIDTDGTIHFEDGFCININAVTEFYFRQ